MFWNSPRRRGRQLHERADVLGRGDDLASTHGFEIDSISPTSGICAGLSTTTSSARWSTLTRYSTLGADAMRSSANSRSRRSWVISMCSRPRKPQRNPKPSATDDSGW